MYGDFALDWYVPRTIEKLVQKIRNQFPALVISGPRQSGKTTLIRHLFKDTHNFVTFDDPLNRERALSDPQLFLENLAPNMILDEIQYVPKILSYIKIMIDQDRNTYGRFILSGSQQFHLIKNLGDSLAGRVAILNLLPFDWQERKSALGERFLLNTRDHFEFCALRGSFPELVIHPEKDVSIWYGSYLQTYLERDVRFLENVGDLFNFQRFIRLLASRCGQILNLSSFSKELGISVSTVKRWLSILQAGKMIYLLQPYHRNQGKRITKNPKVYFLDLGLVSYLTGVTGKEILFNGPLAGAMFKNFIIQEIIKLFVNKGKQPPLYYLRTNNQLEVDLIIEKRYDQIIPVEIKLARTLNSGMARPIERLKNLFDELPFTQGFLVSLNEENFPLTRNVRSVPFESFLQELAADL